MIIEKFLKIILFRLKVKMVYLVNFEKLQKININWGNHYVNKLTRFSGQSLDQSL